MIVEFIGASGSGKTAVASELLASLRALQPGRRSLAAGSGRRPGFASIAETIGILYFPGFLRRLRDAPKGFRELWGHSNPQKRTAVVRLACRYSGLSRVRRTYLFDQGLVHELVCLSRSWSLNDLRGNLEYLYAVVCRAVLPDLVAWIVVDPHVSAERTKMSNRIHRDPAEIQGLCDRFSLHMTFLKNQLSVPVTTASNHGDLGNAVELLRSTISKLTSAEHQ